MIFGVLVFWKIQVEWTKGSPVSFSEQIRPIFNDRCVQCHGGVKQEAGLSLIFRERALSTLESGNRAIVPGKPNKSSLYHRIVSDDPEIRMPFDDHALQPEQIDVIRNWIKDGAEWEDHWAYRAPEDVVVPNIASTWIQNDIDKFILSKLDSAGLLPNDIADPYILIRRTSLDLTGLPPTLEEIETFIGDDRAEAYEHLLDRLLASPHYGERWATMWLDLARYADSKGYEKDNHRDIWKYRDWVINAFNQDMPFDQFSIEQLAGDLLPDPTSEQLVATGFHRNTMNNSEGGVQNEEYRMAAVIDRVNTTWEVWNSTSFGCAQCHGHPYDPFTQEEYYQFLDFFNNTRDEDIGDDSPNLKFYSEVEEEDIRELVKWVASLQENPTSGKLDWSDDIESLLRVTEPKVWSYKAEVINKTAHIGDDYVLEGRNGGIAVFRSFPLNSTAAMLVQGASYIDDGEIIISIDSASGPVIGRWSLGVVGKFTQIFEIEPTTGYRDVYLHFNSKIADRMETDGVGNLFWIVPHEALSTFIQQGTEKQKKKFFSLLEAPGEKTPVMVGNPIAFERKTHILEKGSWMSPTREVSADVPASLAGNFSKYSPDRLGLARWLVNGKHPLTSRVIVNRIWEQLFGAGIVTTLEDFGSQGEMPTHPELLDYLARRLENDHQWSLKKMIKEIMMSSTYRQSSESDARKTGLDPYNHLLSRGARFRLSAEQIRDQTLAASGLLSRKMFGPSVMPHLPEGAWNVVYPQYTHVHWKLSEGDDKYRRGLYTYWKRSSPYPSMMTFDAQARDLCTSRRIRTNTPLQALVTLNDPVFIEAANALGDLMGTAGEYDTITEQIRYGYQMALTKPPTEEELVLLEALFHQADANMRQEVNDDHLDYDNIRLTGPMSVVANAIFNLDAFMMKE